MGDNAYRVSRPRFDGTIINIFATLRSGTATMAANSSTISGVAMSHIALSLSSTEATASVTANNAFDNSNYIDITLSGSSSPIDLLITFECTGRL